jgi:predicted ATP-dependent serine protease
MLEIQALEVPAVYGTPQQKHYSYTKRLNMILAVLEKKELV